MTQTQSKTERTTMQARIYDIYVLVMTMPNMPKKRVSIAFLSSKVPKFGYGNVVFGLFLG